MFDLMNPQLMRMEGNRRRRDILDTIRGTQRAPALLRSDMGFSEARRRLDRVMQAGSPRNAR